MTHSFTSTGTGALAKTEGEARRRVLVTGAAGRIGSYFAEHARQKFDLRLMVMEGEDTGHIQGFGEVQTGNVEDLNRMKQVCAGVDTVLHLAGDPSPSATWDSLLGTNIVGTYNTMVAAKAAGCRRVVFASSIHAVSGYPPDVQVKTSEPVNPGDLYGVSKSFGEALGRYLAEKEDLSVIALRIGAFQPLETARNEENVSMLDAFVSHRDLHQLIERSIDVENIRFAILHGLSDNRFKRLDISDARVLVGYDPQDDFVRENPAVDVLSQPEAVSTHSRADGQESGIRKELAGS